MTYFNSIYYLTDEGGVCRWEEATFRMPTKRCSPMVVTTGTALVVAGGEGEESILRKVEIMDIPSHTWSVAADLPEALIFASVTLCSGTLYLLGGLKGYNRIEKQSMFSCSVDDLLKSRVRLRERRRRSSGSETLVVNVWRTAPGPPVTHSACVAFRGQVLSVGGDGADMRPTCAVYGLNVETGAWGLVSYMTMTRSKCFAVVLPGDEILHHQEELLVVGGRTFSTAGRKSFVEKTDTMELGTVYFHQTMQETLLVTGENEA